MRSRSLEQFKQQGYATHMVGKWHLGTEPEFLPRTQGFDHYYGMPCNYSHSPKFFDDDEEVFAKTPLDRLTQLYTKRVTSIIRDQAKSGEPFFLYYAHNYPHTPYQAGSAFKGTSQDGVRGDVMQELDWSVGEMMAALKEAGVAENTIVIFTSDNGPTANEYAKPYRGTKYVTFEGGHRVPFIFHWPARIKEPSVSDVSIHAMDIFPTLSAAIGSPFRKNASTTAKICCRSLQGSSSNGQPPNRSITTTARIFRRSVAVRGNSICREARSSCRSGTRTRRSPAFRIRFCTTCTRTRQKARTWQRTILKLYGR